MARISLRVRTEPARAFGARSAEQLDAVGAQRCRARRFQADDGDACLDGRAELADGAPKDPPGGAQLAGADPGDRAARGTTGNRHAEPGVLENPDRGDADLRAEVVGERVHEQHHRRGAGGRAARVPAVPGAERCRRKGRQAPALIDASGETGAPGRGRTSPVPRSPGLARSRPAAPSAAAARARSGCGGAAAAGRPGIGPPPCTRPCQPRPGTRTSMPCTTGTDRERR